MLTRTLTRVIMGIALVCASIAWTGWAYLNTAAAPHRFEDVAVAVVADPEARFELAGPLADQIVQSTGIDPSHEPQIRDAVADTLADPRVSANVAAAFGSMHARAVGVDDDRPATIDGAVLVAALRDHLVVANPELAALIPDTAVGDLHLPEFHPPVVATLRRVAVSCTNWLALISIALLACALIVGDRKYALRRFGIWAIVTGMLWAIGPRILVFLAHRWTHDADATIDAAVGAATKVVTAAATGLVAAGICAIVIAQFVALGQSFDTAGEPIEQHPNQRPVRRPPATAPVTVPVTRATYARPPQSAQPAQPAQPARVDTYEPTWGSTPVAGQGRTPAAVAATSTRPNGWGVTQFVGASPFDPPTVPVSDADDVDPWAHFAGPAVPPVQPQDDRSLWGGRKREPPA